MFAGVMLASFVGVVATTLVFASFGLVAVSSSVATGAAAGNILLQALELQPTHIHYSKTCTPCSMPPACIPPVYTMPVPFSSICLVSQCCFTRHGATAKHLTQQSQRSNADDDGLLSAATAAP